jgi:ComF family protein
VILRRLGEILLPASCVFCGSPCGVHQDRICAGCFDDLPWRTSLLEENQPHFEVLAALFDYEFPVDAALKALKFRRRLDYVPAFAALLSSVRYELPSDIDALLPVPLHWRRHAQRGFNQAVELSRELCRQNDWPLLCNIRRHKATSYQSGLEADARNRNLRGAFVARGRITARHVLIIDDVITTGATCRELAAVAVAAGVAKVSVLAVART